MIKKWLICSWLHWKYRCYPEVWKLKSNKWHCSKCTPCGNGLIKLLEKL